MSRQLKLSATLSVLAMVLFASLGSQSGQHTAGFATPRIEAKSTLPSLPSLGNLLPGQR